MYFRLNSNNEQSTSFVNNLPITPGSAGAAAGMGKPNPGGGIENCGGIIPGGPGGSPGGMKGAAGIIGGTNVEASPGAAGGKPGTGAGLGIPSLDA